MRRLTQLVLVVSGLGALMIFARDMPPAPTDASTPMALTATQAQMTPEQRWKTTSPFSKMLAVREKVVFNVTRWEKGGFDNIAFVWAIIENKSEHSFKDIEIECDFNGQSGTRLSTGKKTVYEAFPAKSTRKINRFSMGLIHSQVSNGSCRIGDLVVLD